ncbi:hypothetical protein NOK12_36540 [Nocardioides sp. OK12]|uniref:hypothetical protein n=1 Tax=Nocardioides sp. OK12 TaxID=2758661 RepID=UPI0021C2C5A0|nr:hypothetical protein [Nocardioides sp. OK12]GHJ61136.1 hypothetical protein NOK12_36540 [Nocardioides sp. OK12]
MNSNDSHEIGAALERQVADLHDTPFTLADVQGRARGIRRRRHALVAGVAAAAAAVAVPSALLLGGTLDRTGAPDPAGPSESATEAVDAGTAPSSSVLQGSTLTRPDGTTTELELPDDQVIEYAVLGDGRVVAVPNGGAEILVLGADGEAQASYAAEINHIVVGSTSDTVAWIGDDGAVRVLESGTAEPTVLASPPVERGGYRSVDAVLGSGCAAGGCSVLTGDGNTTQHWVTLEGAREIDLGEPLRVLDFNPDETMFAYAEPPGPNQQYGCVGLRDAATATTITRSCDVWGLSFSPDGRYVEAAFAENGMLGDLRVLDLSLETVLDYEPGGSRVVDSAGWASPDALLVSVAGLRDDQWSLLEVPLDGSEPTTVAGPVQGGNPEIESEFHMSR